VQARKTLALPVLEKLLARLHPSAAEDGGEHSMSMPHEKVLAREHGLPHADGRIPWAAWRIKAAGQDPQDAAYAWITPCHWRVGQDHVAMANPAQLSLSPDESRAFLAAMRDYFEQVGISLEYREPAQWIARGEVFRDLPCASLDRVCGRVIDAWMPRGDKGKALRRLQQEMQMLLYTHPFNDERLARGLPAVNSFWVSGAGALPLSTQLREPRGLRVVNDVREAALIPDWDAWSAAWRDIDRGECAQLLAALDRGEQVALTLCGERNARTFSGAGGGFFGKLRASLRAARAAQVLDSL
jgi:hypothetical protein